jgi:hypothetical protein
VRAAVSSPPVLAVDQSQKRSTRTLSSAFLRSSGHAGNELQGSAKLTSGEDFSNSRCDAGISIEFVAIRLHLHYGMRDIEIPSVVLPVSRPARLRFLGYAGLWGKPGSTTLALADLTPGGSMGTWRESPVSTLDPGSAPQGFACLKRALAQFLLDSPGGSWNGTILPAFTVGAGCAKARSTPWARSRMLDRNSTNTRRGPSDV